MAKKSEVNKTSKTKVKSTKTSKKVESKVDDTKQKSLKVENNKTKEKPKKSKRKPVNSELTTPLEQRTSYTKFSLKNTDNLINRARVKSLKKPILKPELKTTRNLVLLILFTLVLIIIGQFIYKNYINPTPTNYVYGPNEFNNANDSKANVDSNMFTRDILILQSNESRTSLPIKVDEEGFYKVCVMIKSSDTTDVEIRVHTVGTWQKLKAGKNWLEDTINIQKKWRLTSVCSDKKFQIDKGSEPIITVKSDRQVQIANVKLEKTYFK